VASARIAASRTAAVLISSSIALLAAQASPSAADASRASRAPATHLVVAAHVAVRARAASSCANTGLTPQPGNLGLVRAAVLCLIDQEREAHGESALQPNAKLTHAAQGHSEDMASEDYFSHTAPNGETPLDRMRASGYIDSSQEGYEVGENIAWGTLWLASPQSIVSAWMASPGHRANILDAHYRETGIGISSHPPASLADGQTGGIYTQDFGTIVPATGHASRDAGGAAGTGRSHAGDRTGSSTAGGSHAGTGSDLRAHHKDRRHHRRRHRHHHRHHRHKRRRHRKRHRQTRPG
jgi:uncharacterized protein YkwD